VHDQHEQVTVAVHGEPSAILIAPEDLEAEDLYELRTTSVVRRALGEVLPEAGKGLRPPMDDKFSARRGT
jgi:PHD/YefM family antitoxin component YafN of YafNO toxin-antitoxin module